MVIEILSYKSSFCNPLLKLIIPFLFLIAAGYFYQSWRRYGGVLKQISTLLTIMAVAMVIASLFRLQGDIFSQLKWGESIFDLIVAMAALAISLQVRRQLLMIVRVFQSGEEE